jgi:hypothetical protein
MKKLMNHLFIYMSLYCGMTQMVSHQYMHGCAIPFLQSPETSVGMWLNVLQSIQLLYIIVSVDYLREGKMRLWSDADCAANGISTPLNTNSTVCAGYRSGAISACKVGFQC